METSRIAIEIFWLLDFTTLPTIFRIAVIGASRIGRSNAIFVSNAFCLARTMYKTKAT